MTHLTCPFQFSRFHAIPWLDLLTRTPMLPTSSTQEERPTTQKPQPSARYSGPNDEEHLFDDLPTYDQPVSLDSALTSQQLTNHIKIHYPDYSKKPAPLDKSFYSLTKPTIVSPNVVNNVLVPPAERLPPAPPDSTTPSISATSPPPRPDSSKPASFNPAPSPDPPKAPLLFKLFGQKLDYFLSNKVGANPKTSASVRAKGRNWEVVNKIGQGDVHEIKITADNGNKLNNFSMSHTIMRSNPPPPSSKNPPPPQLHPSPSTTSDNLSKLSLSTSHPQSQTAPTPLRYDFTSQLRYVNPKYGMISFDMMSLQMKNKIASTIRANLSEDIQGTLSYAHPFSSEPSAIGETNSSDKIDASSLRPLSQQSLPGDPLLSAESSPSSPSLNIDTPFPPTPLNTVTNSDKSRQNSKDVRDAKDFTPHASVGLQYRPKNGPTSASVEYESKKHAMIASVAHTLSFYVPYFLHALIRSSSNVAPPTTQPVTPTTASTSTTTDSPQTSTQPLPISTPPDAPLIRADGSLVPLLANGLPVPKSDFSLGIQTTVPLDLSLPSTIQTSLQYEIPSSFTITTNLSFDILGDPNAQRSNSNKSDNSTHREKESKRDKSGSRPGSTKSPQDNNTQESGKSDRPMSKAHDDSEVPREEVGKKLTKGQTVQRMNAMAKLKQRSATKPGESETGEVGNLSVSQSDDHGPHHQSLSLSTPSTTSTGEEPHLSASQPTNNNSNITPRPHQPSSPPHHPQPSDPSPSGTQKKSPKPASWYNEMSVGILYECTKNLKLGTKATLTSSKGPSFAFISHYLPNSESTLKFKADYNYNENALSTVVYADYQLPGTGALVSAHAAYDWAKETGGFGFATLIKADSSPQLGKFFWHKDDDKRNAKKAALTDAADELSGQDKSSKSDRHGRHHHRHHYNSAKYRDIKDKEEHFRLKKEKYEQLEKEAREAKERGDSSTAPSERDDDSMDRREQRREERRARRALGYGSIPFEIPPMLRNNLPRMIARPRRAAMQMLINTKRGKAATTTTSTTTTEEAEQQLNDV